MLTSDTETPARLLVELVREGGPRVGWLGVPLMVRIEEKEHVAPLLKSMT